MLNSKSDVFSLSESDNLKNLLKNPEDDFQEIVSILEKKVIERTKHLSELDDRCRSLIDGLSHVGIGIDIVSKEYKILFQNQVLKERFGDCRGKNCYRSYMGLEKPCEFCPMEEALKYNRVERIELKAADGRFYELISAPYPNQDGTIDKVAEVVLDITERKKTEVKLRESENKYKNLSNELETIIDIIPGMLFVKDKNDIVTHVNQNFADSLNSEKEQIIGKTSFDLFPIEQAENFRKDDLEVITSGEPKLNIEESADFPDGKIWAITNKAPYYNEKGDTMGIIGLSINITERKQTEQKLKESGEKYRGLINNITDIIFELGINGKCTYVSNQLFEISGFHPEEMIGQNVFQYLHPEDFLNVSEKVNEAFQEGIRISIDFRIRHKDGFYVPVSSNFNVIKINDSQKFIGVLRDNTEKRKTEQELLKEKEFTETALNTQRDTFFVFEPSTGKAIRWNKAFSEISGYSDREIPNLKAPESYYSKNDLESISEADKLIAKGDAAITELTLITKERKLIPFEYAASGIFDDDNKLKYVVVIDRNITERKEVEKVLHHERDLIRTLLENHPDFIYFKDSKARFQHISKRFCEFFGRNMEDIIGKTDLELFPEELAKQTHSEDLQVIKTGIPLINKEENTAGTWVLTTKIPWIDNEGKIKGLFGISRDITERKKAEQKLKESEEKYHVLFDNSPIGIGLSTLEGEVLDSNDAMIELTGYSLEDLKKIGSSSIYVDPNARSEILKLLQEVGKIRDYEVKLKRKDNTEYFGSLSVDIIELGGKKIMQSSHRDITERKKAEEKLKESEENFRTIAEDSHLAITILQDDLVVYTNQKMADMFGYEREEMLKWTPKEYAKTVAEDSLEFIMEQARKKQIGDPDIITQYPIHCVKRSGEKFWVDNISTTIIYNGHPADLVTIIDTTDKREAQQRLKDSEEKFRNLFEKSPNAIALIDFTGKIIDCNLATEKTFGYSIEDLKDRNYLELPFYSESMINKLKERFQAITKTFEIEPQDLEIKKKDGNIAWIKTEISYFKIGEQNFFQAIIQDITEQKQAEQKLKESEEKFRTIAEQSLIGISIIQDNIIKYVNNKMSDILGYSINEIMNWTPEEYINTIHPDYRSFIFEQEKIKQQGLDYEVLNYQFQVITKSGNIIWVENYIREIKFEGRSADLIIYIDITERKEAEQELLKLNQLKSELLRRTSHELKTPLVSIKGFSDLLLEIHRDKLDSLVISTLNEIKQGCLRLESLIADILKTAELESGTTQLHKSEEDLSFLVRACVNEIKGFSKLRNHTINLDFHDNLITHFEKEQIHQVIGNLLNNAVKYTPPSGLIEIKSDIRDAFIVLAIKDNGIGFTEEEKTRIFKQFGKIERYGQGMDIIAEGSGFGLFISKKIVELHGGDIWVESEGRNKGSTFYFSLPII